LTSKNLVSPPSAAALRSSSVAGVPATASTSGAGSETAAGRVGGEHLAQCLPVVREQAHHVRQRGRIPERRAVDVQVHGRLPGNRESERGRRAEELGEGGAMAGGQGRGDDLAGPFPFAAGRGGERDGRTCRVVQPVDPAVLLDLRPPEPGDRVEDL
jgi:hypothetical protein